MPTRNRFTWPLQIECLEDRTLLATSLGTAETFAVLGGSAVTNTRPSAINGNLGVSPGTSVTGFPPGIVTNGTIHAADAVALQAQNDVTTAYNILAAKPVTVDLTGQDLGGLTLTPGVYFFSTSAQLTGTLTLNALGNPNAEFDFQIGSTLTTATNASVVLINNANPCDAYWQVGSSATLGTNTQFVGHILALTSITMNTSATLNGSALARNGAVTLDSNTVSTAFCALGSISGMKFNDLNGDGVQQAGDIGLAGLTVFLDYNNNGVLDAGENSAITDANGNYSFANLLSGTYLVREAPQAGVLQTSPNPAPIILPPGGTVTDVNIGDFLLISISGVKFQDTNGSGVRDAGEPGLPGFTIFLDTNNNGVLDAGETSTVTDVNGNYSFANLGPGTYHVREVQQTGFTQTTANPLNFVASSNANVSNAAIGNFGTFIPISISGTKFQDTNSSGVRDPGEPGLQGFTIFLDTNNNSVLDAGETRTTTDANGNYSFSNLGAGTYHVREVQQSGFTQTTANPPIIVAISGTNVSGVLFGNFGSFIPGSISGTKFQDTNGNGARDPGEAGLLGFTIFLDANLNGVLDSGESSTTTDANGNYTFANLSPGTYRVREVQKVNFVQMTNNPPDIVVTASGANVTGIGFGNIPVVNLVTISKLLLTGANLTNLLDGTFAQQANFIANLYQTRLGRAPDLAGLTYYLRLLQAGYTEPQVAAMFPANSVSSNAVMFQGTAGDDNIVVDFRSGVTVVITINGSASTVNPAVTPAIIIDALGGRDSIVFYGSAGSETFNVQSHIADMTGMSVGAGSFNVHATNIEVDSIDGGGGSDNTIMHTSTINDVFVGAPGEGSRNTYAALYATDGSFYTVAFNTPVTAINDSPKNGATHAAVLFTSSADDAFVAAPQSAKLSGAGAGAVGQGPFSFTAQSFPSVIAYNAPANTGLHTATFSTSSVNDIFVGVNNTYAELFSAVVGAAFNNVAYHFQTMSATNLASTPGVTHDAILYTSTTGSDNFAATGATASLTGTSVGNAYSFNLQKFTTVSAINQAGSSLGTAVFTGLADDDVFFGTSTFALMTNGKSSDPSLFRNVAYGFSTNTATALPGSQHSLARLYDSAGSDLFFGRHAQGSLLNNTVNNFHEVDAASVNGGTDTVDVANLDYVFMKLGNWAN